MHHIIIGAGPAGVIAAETLRKEDSNSEITLIGGEPEPPYSRMAIPYYLSGDVEEQGTYLRQTPSHYDDLGVKFQNETVDAIFAGRNSLKLSGGEEWEYDRLLIATGATPVRPPINGLSSSGVHTCWTLEDARNIASLAQKGQSVVLLGAGFIGSIILEALTTREVNLTVIEMADRMVPRMLDETAGAMLEKWCKSKSVDVQTNTRITEVSGSSPNLEISFDSGKKIEASLLVVAAGVAPNIGFLASSGIGTGLGVKVDKYLRTNLPNIYAAGDVAEGRDFSSGEFSVLAIQPTAVEHGRLAALNMVGKTTPHRGSLNMNVLDTIGLISSSFGSWMGVSGGERATLVEEKAYRYLRLEFNGDRLIGAQTLGLMEHIGVIRGLIQTELPLGQWKSRLIKSPGRIAEAYVACAQGIAPL